MRIETKLKDIKMLLRFNNQQVIINIYQEDELIQREGLFFESVTLIDNKLQFQKGSKLLFSLPLKNFTSFTQQQDFKHYYSLENEESRVDLYFP